MAASAEASKTGWVYILDRVTGKPLIGIDEKPVVQEPRQFTSPAQPFPRGGANWPPSSYDPALGSFGLGWHPEPSARGLGARGRP
jgi:hypothetical protein